MNNDMRTVLNKLDELEYQNTKQHSKLFEKIEGILVQNGKQDIRLNHIETNKFQWRDISLIFAGAGVVINCILTVYSLLKK